MFRFSTLLLQIIPSPLKILCFIILLLMWVISVAGTIPWGGGRRRPWPSISTIPWGAVAFAGQVCCKPPSLRIYGINVLFFNTFAANQPRQPSKCFVLLNVCLCVWGGGTILGPACRPYHGGPATLT